MYKTHVRNSHFPRVPVEADEGSNVYACRIHVGTNCAFEVRIVNINKKKPSGKPTILWIAQSSYLTSRWPAGRASFASANAKINSVMHRVVNVKNFIVAH